MTSPGYVAVLVLHALSALAGFGALAMTGLFARRAASVRDPFGDDSLRRFFAPGGPNLAAAALLAVPVLGAVLLVLGPSSDVHRAFAWIGLGCWAFAVLAAATVAWPCQSAVRELLARGGETALLRRIARRCERGVAVAVVSGLVGLVVMIARP